MKQLTHRQQEVLGHILDHLELKNSYPAYRWIADKMGVRSKYTIICHLEALERKGYLQRRKDSKSIRPGFQLTNKAATLLNSDLDIAHRKLEKIRILTQNLSTYIDLASMNGSQAVNKVRERILEIINE